MAANLHRDTADLRFSVALHDHLEGPLPLFRDGLPSDLEVHIIAVIPATVGAAGLVGEGQKCAHQRVLRWGLHQHPQQVKVTGPVHKVLVELAEMGQFLRSQRDVSSPSPERG